MPASIDKNGDVVGDLTTKFKARTESIVIDNSNTKNKLVTIDESMRTLDAAGNMGADPLLHYNHTFPLKDIIDIEIDGITGLQVMTWIQKWAAGVNLADYDLLASKLTPKA